MIVSCNASPFTNLSKILSRLRFYHIGNCQHGKIENLKSLCINEWQNALPYWQQKEEDNEKAYCGFGKDEEIKKGTYVVRRD